MSYRNPLQNLFKKPTPGLSIFYIKKHTYDVDLVFLWIVFGIHVHFRGPCYFL